MQKNLLLIYFLFISTIIPNNVTVSMFDESKYEDGYTIFGTLEGKYSAIIDKNGNEIWNSGAKDIVYYNFSNEGRFLGCQFLDDNIYDNYLNSIEFSLCDEIIWKEPSIEFAHHEILTLPWGNYLGIVSNDTIAPLPEGNFGALPFFPFQGYTTEFPWRYDKIVEWDKDTKEIIWSWSTMDHYSINDFDSTLWNMTTLNNKIIEWTHLNALYFDKTDSSIYISSRHLSRITKINYPSGEIIWNLGREMPSGDVDFGHELGFSWQHSIDFKDGNIIFLDNGNKSENFRGTLYRTTRALEISIDESSSPPTTEIIWQYDLPENLFGMASGNVQKLDNGNYLITTMGDDGTTLEISQTKEIIWSANYDTPLIYRAHRVSRELIDSLLNCTSASISNHSIPNSFNLTHLYPNPFNPSINIKYSIETYSFIYLEIYNLNGELIEKIKADYHIPGHYEIQWNANTKASGIYFIRIGDNSNFLSKKIIFLK